MEKLINYDYSNEYLINLDKFIKEIRENNKKIKGIKNSTNDIILASDMIFKSIFKNNIDILYDFISLILKKELDLEENAKIEIKDSEMSNEKLDEQTKHLDIIVSINQQGKEILVNLELNAYEFEYVKLRNLMYLCKVYGTILKRSEKYKVLNNKYAYQVNLNFKDKETKRGKAEITLCSKIKQRYIKNFKIFNFNIDYYKDKYYNGDRLNKKELWLALFATTSLVQMSEILDKITTKEKKNRILRGVIEMEDFCMEYVPYEEYIIAEAKYDAYNNGISQGISQGLTQGISQEKEQTAINMLNKKLDINLISECTGLDKKKILSLKKNK